MSLWELGGPVTGLAGVGSLATLTGGPGTFSAPRSVGDIHIGIE